MARCQACEVVMVTYCGKTHRCHELGCPEKWRDEVRECEWCGQEFKPESQKQSFCEVECERAYLYPEG